MSKPTATAKQASAPKGSMSSSALFAPAIIIGAFVVAQLVFHFVMGDGSHFEGGDPVRGHPIGGNILGTIYKGGFIVPLLITLFICVIVFSIERYLTLLAAEGKGAVPEFLKRVKASLESNNVDAAINECDKQRGSVANIVRGGLVKYKEMSGATDMDRDQKVAAIQQELEEIGRASCRERV